MTTEPPTSPSGYVPPWAGGESWKLRHLGLSQMVFICATCGAEFHLLTSFMQHMGTHKPGEK